MPGMRYQLHHDVAITWVSGTHLRVGTALDAVIVPDSQLTHDLIDLLRQTAELQLLQGTVRASTESALEGNRILNLLLTQCEPITGGASRLRVVVRAPASADAFTQLVASEIARRGVTVRVGGADVAVPDSTDLVVDIGDRVVAPTRYLPLMSRDVPHLLMIRDVRAVVIGPLVVPGLSPCIRCSDLERLDHEPGWLVTATQLLDLPPPSVPLDVELIAALECGMAVDALARSSPRESITSRAPSSAPDTTEPTTHWYAGRREIIQPGRRDSLQLAFHAGCGCRIPAETATVHQIVAPTSSEGVLVRG